MSWFRWLRRDTQPAEQRANLALLADWTAVGSSSYAEVTRAHSPEQALRLSTVWACVRLLADTVSTFPVDVYRQGSKDPLPTPPLLESPAAGTTLPEWIYQCMVSLLLRGNAYGVITARSGPTLRPAQVELIDPDLVDVPVAPDGAVQYRVHGKVRDPADIWHVRAYLFPGHPTGLSPITYAAWSIGLGLAATRYAGQFFEQSATPTGVLTMEGRLSQDAADRLKATWEAAHRGRRDTAVLEDGVEFKPIQATPEDSALVELSKWTVAEVARVFGVPPEMVAGEAGNSLTYGNVEGRAQDFLRYSVSPWLVRLEDAIGRLLPRGQYVKFNVDSLLRPTTTERYAVYKTAIETGIMTINEIRALEDLPPLADGSGAIRPAAVA